MPLLQDSISGEGVPSALALCRAAAGAGLREPALGTDLQHAPVPSEKA